MADPSGPAAAPRAASVGTRAPSLGPLFRKLSGFAALTDDDARALRVAFVAETAFEPGRTLLGEGERGERGYVVLDGWAFCFKELPDGRRQIVNFQLTGDFLGMRSLLLHVSDHSFATLTQCRLASIRLADWRGLIAERPRLATALLWSAARNEALIVEHLVNVGRRTADLRTAHLLCELGLRLRALGRVTGDRVVLPLTQPLVADALGLSVVHLNRSLRRLREAGLIDVGAGRIEIADFSRLLTYADFDESYMTF